MKLLLTLTVALLLQLYALSNTALTSTTIHCDKSINAEYVLESNLDGVVSRIYLIDPTQPTEFVKCGYQDEGLGNEFLITATVIFIIILIITIP